MAQAAVVYSVHDLHSTLEPQRVVVYTIASVSVSLLPLSNELGCETYTTNTVDTIS